jgi:hypothetical protein
MSSFGSTSLDELSSLPGTAHAPVRDACLGGNRRASRRHRAHPALLTLSIAFGMASLDAQAAETFRKLSGHQIVEALAGMQFGDEAHWREVYERNGALRNYRMGRERLGKWHVDNGRLCLAFPSENTGDCFDVWIDGKTIEMRRDAEDRHPIMGIVETPSDPSAAAMTK